MECHAMQCHYYEEIPNKQAPRECKTLQSTTILLNEERPRQTSPVAADSRSIYPSEMMGERRKDF